MASSNHNSDMYSCEVCGLRDLTSQQFFEHTQTNHIDGKLECPFCDYLVDEANNIQDHVATVHSEFLTPTQEMNTMTFIDASPSGSEWKNLASNSNGVYQSSVSPKVVSGGADLSIKAESHGQGSPQRSNLNLKLKNPQVLQCPICRYTSTSPGELEEHVNRQHFDLTSPSIGNTTGEVFACPLCSKSFNSAPDLELHVNIEHKDVLSPASPTNSTCPICGLTLDNDNNSDAAARHVESHFPAGSPQPIDREALKKREEREFELLRAQYGMDNQGNFREQSVTNMQRAVYAGEMSVADYYERTLDLRQAESCGIDDGSSVTRGLIPRIRALSISSQNVSRTYICTCVDHYASSYGDRGWGCGYRNTQMLISSLLKHTGYNERLYTIWQNQKPPRSSVPSISRLQGLIEEAWAQGFDLQGSEQLGSRLVNTRKWIGATEVMTLLSYLRIRCQLIDFHRPTGPGGTHPELFAWVLNYFENCLQQDFTPPLYLQHQGHSRTIMGIEVHKDGSLVLLLLDPSHSPQQMAQFADTNTGSQALRLLRKGEAYMKARQYQIVAAVGMIESEQQYQQSKVLRGLRIPQDR
ncbi:zinc finger-containing ubiquitin peptidase 1-like [Onthophagus taurus]|uniref:zinc finger-containing ubiquitin peptidase 1-like n=1 Tax=Onthophagus taurus TaxID=166361 RepID=UPI000C1FE5D0|nr:zinc finger with UFM1-specific peptidase domain protein-like [Onthophagus taurus]